MKTQEQRDAAARAMREKNGAEEVRQGLPQTHRVREVARALGVSESTVHNRIRGNPKLKHMPPTGKGKRLVPLIDDALFDELQGKRPVPLCTKRGG